MSFIDTEILDGFRAEAKQLLSELETVVEGLEDVGNGPFPAPLLAEFAQKIDRIMGAAKTIGMATPGHLGLERVGKLAELCKYIGYKAAEKRDGNLIPLFAAFWADTLEVLSALIDSLNDVGENEKIAKDFSIVLQRRLEWLSKHVAPDITNLVQRFK